MLHKFYASEFYNNLIQNSPLKKVCCPEEGHFEKDVESKVVAKKQL